VISWSNNLKGNIPGTHAKAYLMWVYLSQLIFETANPVVACQPANQVDATKAGASVEVLVVFGDDTGAARSRRRCARGLAETAATRRTGRRRYIAVKRA
jgi:hypothetical protein